MLEFIMIGSVLQSVSGRFYSVRYLFPKTCVLLENDSGGYDFVAFKHACCAEENNANGIKQQKGRVCNAAASKEGDRG